MPKQSAIQALVPTAPQQSTAQDPNNLDGELGALDDVITTIKSKLAPDGGFAQDPNSLDGELGALDDAVTQLKQRVQQAKDAQGGGASPDTAALYQQRSARGGA